MNLRRNTMRIPTKTGLAVVALATAATMTFGVQSASGTHQDRSSAYGLSLGGSPGQPAAAFPQGPRQAGGQLPAELEQLAAGGILTVTAGDDHATAKVTDLTLGDGLSQLPAEVKDGLQQISSVCDQLPAQPAPDVDQQLFEQLPGGLQEIVNTPGNLRDLCGVIGDGSFAQLASIDTLQAECTGNSGTVEVSNARVFGSTTPLNDTGDAPKNFSVLPAELAPLIEITLNRQTTKGQDFTVDGLVLKLGGQEVAVLASATCGGPIAHGSTPREAPRPTPVRNSVPVTG
jgi:hypothetical protein